MANLECDLKEMVTVKHMVNDTLVVLCRDDCKQETVICSRTASVLWWDTAVPEQPKLTRCNTPHRSTKQVPFPSWHARLAAVICWHHQQLLAIPSQRSTAEQSMTQYSTAHRCTAQHNARLHCAPHHTKAAGQHLVCRATRHRT